MGRTCDKRYPRLLCGVLVRGAREAHERGVEGFRDAHHGAREGGGTRELAVDCAVGFDLSRSVRLIQARVEMRGGRMVEGEGRGEGEGEYMGR